MRVQQALEFGTSSTGNSKYSCSAFGVSGVRAGKWKLIGAQGLGGWNGDLSLHRVVGCSVYVHVLQCFQHYAIATDTRN